MLLKSIALLVLLLVEQPAGPAQDAILRGPETRAALEYRFTPEDETLLDEIEHACFLYFWNEVGTPAKLVKDRKLGPVASIAAVGFQLSSLPIGVERKWCTKIEARERALTILKALVERDDNKKWGMYLHFPDLNNGGPSHEGYSAEASTVDTALFLAGAIPAAEYFGGEVKTLVERALMAADWKRYAVAKGGMVAMAWKPAKDVPTLDGAGAFTEWSWWNNSDEERLVYLLAVGAPDPNHALEPAAYYSLKRSIKGHKELPPFVVSWPGTLFTYFFSHCWIEYRGLGPDAPAKFGGDGPRVDWFENSRRAVITHRQRCIEAADKFKTFATDRWGMSACDGRDGYLVPEIQPNLSNNDDFGGGTIAPYAAGSSIIFTPKESLAALRAFRELRKRPDGSFGGGTSGELFVWRDPLKGGYGFADSFNLDQKFASPDFLGIDQGPMLLMIENARTGLIWKLFMKNEMVQRGLTKLQIEPIERTP